MSVGTRHTDRQETQRHKRRHQTKQTEGTSRGRPIDVQMSTKVYQLCTQKLPDRKKKGPVRLTKVNGLHFDAHSIWQFTCAYYGGFVYSLENKVVVSRPENGRLFIKNENWCITGKSFSRSTHSSYYRNGILKRGQVDFFSHRRHVMVINVLKKVLDVTCIHHWNTFS